MSVKLVNRQVLVKLHFAKDLCEGAANKLKIMEEIKYDFMKEL